MKRLLAVLLLCALFAPPTTAASDDGYILTTNERTLSEIEQAYWEMPQISYVPPKGRFERLPATARRFADGGALNVVMLGDSIVNDTSRSCWNLLLDRAYAGTSIRKVTSVRGSTGCWWYKDDDRVQRFVLDHKPDLIIIGGISQRDDIDSIREVIGQIKKGCKADILLMTGAFGGVDPNDEGQWQRISDPEHFSKYRRELEALADETKSAFLDMELAWASNIRASGKELDWFKRDPVHANIKGEQILGRILATYLSPDAHDFILTQTLVTDPLVTRKLETYRDWKFGFMMHWGIYSQWGCIESWPLVEVDTWARPDDLKAWTERGNDFEKFSKDYVALNKTFRPRNFAPQQWAAAAKEAGMKYVVFTTKHHDGFCLFDTAQTDYRTTDPSCPFHEDPRANVVKQVFDAFRHEGFGIGAYYSKSDWHHPGYWAPEWPHRDRNVNYDTAEYPEKWKTFVDFTHSVVEELMTTYGPVDILWLDGGQVRPPKQDIDMPRLAAMAREHQPGLIVVDRTVGGVYENYRTPEQQIPEKALPYVWETCMTMGDQWSYKPNDSYKSTTTLVHMLVDIVAKGGNFLLNVGPDPDGNLPEPALVRMKEIGKWLDVNGEAIYGTRPIAPFKRDNICFTQRGDTLYAILLLDEGQTTLPTTMDVELPVVAKAISLLGTDAPVTWSVEGNRLHLEIPEALAKSAPCKDACVFRMSY